MHPEPTIMLAAERRAQLIDDADQVRRIRLVRDSRPPGPAPRTTDRPRQRVQRSRWTGDRALRRSKHLGRALVRSAL